MSKFIVTLEIDPDRDLYGSAWGANVNAAKHTDEDILEGLKGGALISSGWDFPPFMRAISTLNEDTEPSVAIVGDRIRVSIPGENYYRWYPLEGEEINELESKLRYERDAEEEESLSIGGGAFGDFYVKGFKATDENGNSLDGIVSLGSLDHGAHFADTDDEEFTVIGYGPVQGTVEVANGSDARVYAETDTYVEMVGK